MKWRSWKLGLIVAGLTGVFGALATLGVVKDIGGWQQFVLILAIGISKDALLFLKQHPVEAVEDPNPTKPDEL